MNVETSEKKDASTTSTTRNKEVVEDGSSPSDNHVTKADSTESSNEKEQEKNEISNKIADADEGGEETTLSSTEKENGKVDNISNKENDAEHKSETSLDEKSLIESLRAQVSDLTTQVTSLNTKLVGSFGKIGDLEDELFQSKSHLTQAKDKVSELERERQAWDDSLEGGVYVEKAHVQAELSRMMDRVLSETNLRKSAESDKALFEQELDDLSASLFAEANAMVSTERKARHMADEKSKSLAERLKDTEVLMASQGAQLRELGEKLEQAERERDQYKLYASQSDSSSTASENDNDNDIENENDTKNITNSTNLITGEKASSSSELTNSTNAPPPPPYNDSSSSSIIIKDPEDLTGPIIHHATAPAPSRPHKSSKRTFASSNSCPMADFFYLHHRLPPIMTNIVPYGEFLIFVNHLYRVRQQTIFPPSTPPSIYGEYQHSYTQQSQHQQHQLHPTGSTTSTSSSTTMQNQHLPQFGYQLQQSPLPSPNHSQFPQPTEEQMNHLRSLLPLSVHTSQPFMKRCIEEDSDPTVRLDFAPGLNFLSRREISKSIIDGLLVIEPASNSANYVHSKCTLCGIVLNPNRSQQQLDLSSSTSTTAGDDHHTHTNNSTTPTPSPHLDSVSTLTPSSNSTLPVTTESSTRQSVRKWVGGVSYWRNNFSKPSGTQHSSSQSISGEISSSTTSTNATTPSATNINANTTSSSDQVVPIQHTRSSSNPISNSNTDNNSTAITPASSTNSPQVNSFSFNQQQQQQRSSPQVYIFRSSETSTTSYPICQPYCLARLRAVCEFWTFIRAIERAVLLNEKLGSSSSSLLSSSSKKTPSSLGKGLGGLFRLTSMSSNPSQSKQADSESAPTETNSSSLPPRWRFDRSASGTENKQHDDDQTNTTNGEPEKEDNDKKDKDDGDSDNKGKEIATGNSSQGDEKPSIEKSAQGDNAKTDGSSETTGENKSDNDNDNGKQQDDQDGKSSLPLSTSTSSSGDSMATAQSLSSNSKKPPLPKRSSKRKTSLQSPIDTPTSATSATSTTTTGNNVDDSEDEVSNQQNKQVNNDVTKDTTAKGEATVTEKDSKDLQEQATESGTEKEGVKEEPPAKTVTATDADTASPSTTTQDANEPSTSRLPNLPGHTRNDSSDSYNSSHNQSTAVNKWEEQCWTEIIRLKLLLYWTRVGADLPEHDISAASALARISRSNNPS